MIMLRPSFDRAFPFATFALVTAFAGCTHVSLKEQPQVLDWSSGAQTTVVQAQGAPAGVLYTVRRDDTLAAIATRFNTTPATLAAWNNLGPNPRIRPDQVLRVSPPGAATTIDANPVATTQPIGNEGVEARPIGSEPAPPPAEPPPTVLPPTITPPPSNAPLKTGPLGLKKPYSDAALAELAKQDEAVASIAPTAPVAAANAPTVSWAWPTPGQPGTRFDDKSKGIDIAGKAGDPVLAAADGKVTFAGTGVRGYGNFVIVQHAPDLLSVYAHNRANLVKEGTSVTKGQKIAEMGNTDTDGVKLHFEIRRDSKPVDPLQYLPQR